jgi:hypothetical protein
VLDNDKGQAAAFGDRGKEFGDGIEPAGSSADADNMGGSSFGLFLLEGDYGACL